MRVPSTETEDEPIAEDDEAEIAEEADLPQ
jgi:hypothetical protein